MYCANGTIDQNRLMALRSKWGIKTSRKRLLREVLFKEQSGKCALCGSKIAAAQRGTLDHKQPLAHGGSNHITNLQLVHRRCNNRKGHEWEDIMIS